MDTTITLTFAEKKTLQLFLKDAVNNNNALLKEQAQSLLNKIS